MRCNIVSKDLAYWVGVIQTDGCFKKREYKKKKCVNFLISIQISLESLPMLQKVREISRKLFSRNAKIWRLRGRDRLDYSIGVTELIPIFEKMDIKFSDPPTPPNWVKTPDLFGPYLAGVIDGDGQSIRGIDFVTVGLSNITLRDLSVINCVLDGIRLKGITNLKINNLLVDNCGQQSLQHNIYPMRIYNGNFSNIITINSPAGAGLKMRGVQNVLITNLVSKSNQDGLVIAGGDSSEDTTENVIVDGFSFVGNSRYGFHTYDEKATSRWITLANGVIRESGQDGIALHASGTRWIDISNVIVMNSGIETPNTYNGVDISEGRWITITGCIIADLNYAVADRTQKDGIYISSDAKDIIVTGNLFTRNRGYGVNNESTRVRIYNNYYYENNLGDIVGGSVNKGTATIPNGSSSVVVNHGLHSAPSVVKLTGTHSEVKDCWVTNVTDTQFTINAPAAVTADRDVYWQAEV